MPLHVAPEWKPTLIAVRTQIADYEREGTSTPGKLKRAARLRASRRALATLGAEHASAVALLKRLLAQIEAAEKDDNWSRIAELVRQLLAEVDSLVGGAG
ncbi:MAG: hypothetical protein ACRD1C_02355 [Terriglobales bacterium]